MSKIEKIIRHLKDDNNELCALIIMRYFKWLPDSFYLSLLYRLKMKHSLNLKHPQTFSEKIQWLKLNNRRPEYTALVDKFEVKQYVADRIGEQYIIPTLKLWKNVDDIKLASLPDQFVLKTTHGGGGCGVVICRDKANFDLALAKTKLNKSLSSDIYSIFREWPYKNVNRRIIAEQLLMSSSGSNDLPNDFKFFCFNGKVNFFKVDFGRFREHHANYYSPDGKLLEFGEFDCPPIHSYPVKLPHNLSEMITIAEKLSQGHPFIRVDLYNVDGRIYFGELTFYPA